MRIARLASPRRNACSPKVARICMIREPQKFIRYVTPEHFAAMYAACDAARHPSSEARWYSTGLTPSRLFTTSLPESNRQQKDENGERVINLPCREKREHNDACYLYGFHDLRCAFATQNALRLTPDALQALMRHKSYLTTKRYINMARQLDGAVEQLHVPEFLTGT